MSVKDALESYSKKQLQSNRTTSRKNKKPEQKTVNACMAFFEEYGFSMHIVESKAVYSVAAGGYIRGQTVSGFSDSAGCTPTGVGCFVEFKAKGKRSTLRLAQKEFLKEKILKGCFACVVDSDALLKEYYSEWSARDEFDDRVSYLFNLLPKKKEKTPDLF